MCAHGIERGMEVLERGRDLLHEKPAGIGQRHAASCAVEQPHAQPSLQPADRVAQGGCRHSELDGRSPECPAPGNGGHRFKVLQADLFHCPVLFIIAC